MQGFADFLDSLLGGTLLVALALAVGGVVWTFAVLRPWRGDVEARLVRRALVIAGVGAGVLALVQVTHLALKVWLLSDYLGRDALPAFTGTLQFRAGTVRTLLAAGLAGACFRLARRPATAPGWAVLGTLAALVAGAGAWLVHAAGRFEHRPALMAFTVLHQVGAAVWVGGLIELLALARLARRDPAAAGVWPVLVARFSRLAVATLVVLVAAGLPLGVYYVGSLEGLVGTAYGSLLATKVGLMAAVLLLAALNFRAARARGPADAGRAALPDVAAAEAILLVVLLFTAASLSSQPPPVDGAQERATFAEVVEVFRPKWPSLRTPTVAAKLRDATAAVGLAERTTLAYSWSNFSHNVAGLLLLGMSLAALVGRWRPAWARHWPLGFVALAAFVFLRTSASEGTWPFGPAGVWENAAGDAEALQHRIGAAVALALGLLEWRARAARHPPAFLPYLFPVLAAAGGILLLTHSHTAFEPKSAYLIQVTHSTMGALAVVMAAGRWLELRLHSPVGRAGGTAATVAMLLIALILVFYREANIVVPVA
jgi:putative copper resistance protein D